MSARAVWSLSLARGAGYAVAADSYDKSLRYLAAQLAVADDTDRESKSLLLHALSVAGRGDFSLANRLYRERPSLSTAALLHLALAFAEMDRKPIAAELLTLVTQRKPDAETAPGEPAPGDPLSRNRSPVELRALWALAVQAAPAAIAPGEGTDHLAVGPPRRPPLVARQGHRPGHAGPCAAGSETTTRLWCGLPTARRSDID